MRAFFLITGLFSVLIVFSVLITPAPGSAAWEQVNTDGFGSSSNTEVLSLCTFNNCLYAGTKNDSGCGVWRSCDGTSWEQVNTPGFGDAGNTKTYSLAVFGSCLYAGTENSASGIEIWRTADGTSWEQACVDGFGDLKNTKVAVMEIYNGALYAGTYNGSGCEVWRTADGTSWEQVNTNGFGKNYTDGVYSTSVFNNDLYIGTYDSFYDCGVWRLIAPDNNTWEEVNSSGFGDSSNDYAISMAVYNNMLYVGTGGSSADCQVWRTADGTSWEQVNTSGFGDSSNTYARSMAVYNDALYVGTKHTGGCEIWEMTGLSWRQVNTDGFGDGNNDYALSMVIFDNHLYVGTVNNETGCELWRSDGDFPTPGDSTTTTTTSIDQDTTTTTTTTIDQDTTTTTTTSIDQGTTTTTTTSILSITSTTKAIIVAGGGPYKGNSLWDATQVVANYAYKALQFQGYTSEDIYYLTHDDQIDIEPDGIIDQDDEPTNDNLEYAVTEWASDADDVMVYITDHGGKGTFRLSEDEILYATQLDSWLDALQDDIRGTVTVVYDACKSGSFLMWLVPEVGKNRIVISSTSNDQFAYFVAQGTVSFSRYFWSNIFDGQDVYEAFKLAKNAMEISGYQIAQLDDNGNGVGNEKNDGAIAREYVIGAGNVKGEDIPIIGSISDDQTLNSGTSATIRVDGIICSGTIVMVWALIKEPGMTVDNASTPVTDLPSVVLTKISGGNYQGSYDGFTKEGTYYVSVYAMDENGNVSLPKVTTVRQLQSAGSCPAVMAGGGKNETTALLRRFRDDVLMTTPEGRELVGLYYRHAPEVASILSKNPEIMAQCKEMLVMIVPELRSMRVIDTRSYNTIKDILMPLLQVISTEASPGLWGDIENRCR